MKKLIVLAAVLMATTSAHAGGSYSFRINGQQVRIDVPRNCSALSCINIQAPGLKFSDSEDEPAPARSSKEASTEPSAPSVPAPTWNAKPATIPAETSAAPSAPAVSAPAPVLPERSALPSEPRETMRPAETVVASAPAPVQAEAPKAASPLGTWSTEKKEGLVRIEPCGANLCGYSVNAKTNLNGDKVLIDMKPSGDKWKGRIKDTRNGGGGIYDSTMALKSADSLRVQGCAFGGMFCGGQTWTRVN